MVLNRGCAYAMFLTVQMLGVLDFLLSRYCHNRPEDNIKQYSLTHSPRIRVNYTFEQVFEYHSYDQTCASV